MKTQVYYAFFLLSFAFLWAGCEKSNYPGATISPYIPLFDLKSLYKGADVTLTTENMFGSSKITGIVVSDHSGGNMPAGLLVVQDKRRLNELRGISIPIGDDASNYVPGDSVIIDIQGGVLKRVEGTLQITGIPASAVSKISSGNAIAPNRVASSSILANPDKYESTLVIIVKGGFDPLPVPSDILSGDKVLNDGFDNINLHTEPNATFAKKANLPVVGNFYGIIFSTLDPDGKLVPQHRIRNTEDIVYLSSKIEITPILISGYIADVRGGDGNYEYMQFLATRAIDFAATPFSVVTTNNAGATNPTGFPSQGWATGALAKSGNSRTYKFNLTSGTVSKGEFFYVGGSTKMINGSSSTSMANSKWIRAFNYSTTNGDGFGLSTSGLFANSGNASGFAVFEGTNVTAQSTPIDVIFIGAGGSLLNAEAGTGYRIGNTDFYDIINPITLESQPFYRQGSNTINFIYQTADLGYFNKLGGIYNPALGKWVKARTQTPVLLLKTSVIEEIEGVFPKGIEGQEDVPSTSLKL